MTIHQPSRSSMMLAMFRAGNDTLEIAHKLGVKEAVVYNAISLARRQETAPVEVKESTMFAVSTKHTMRNAKPYVEPHVAAENQRRATLKAEMLEWAAKVERARLETERVKAEAERAKIAKAAQKAREEWKAKQMASAAAAAAEKNAKAAAVRAARLVEKGRAPRVLPLWAARMVSVISGKHNLTFDDIMGKSRNHRIVKARNEVFYKLKNSVSPVSGARPSHAQIGEWFCREHTGVIFGVAKHAEQNGLPRINQMDAAARVTRNRIRTQKNTADRRFAALPSEDKHG